MLMTRPRNVDNVSVSYEEGNQRIVKRFTDPILARRFFAVKSREGKSPKVHRAAEVSTMSVENTNVAVVETTEAAPVVVAKKKPTPRKAPAAKKPTPKPAPAPKGKKPAVKEAAAPAPKAGSDSLNGSETKILTALSKASSPMTRDDLRKKTGIQKGYSGLLGSHTKEVQPETLLGRGLVKVSIPAEGQRQHGYEITAKGKKELEKAK